MASTGAGLHHVARASSDSDSAQEDVRCIRVMVALVTECKNMPNFSKYFPGDAEGWEFPYGAGLGLQLPSMRGQN